jgi:tetratricopeptide (TPR) repeat protein
MNPLQAAQQAHSAGDLQTAERLYRQVLAQQPANFDALHLLGVARAQQGQYDEARRLIAKALALNPRDPGALSNLGNVLSELNRPAEAVESLKRALALKPDYVEGIYNLGNALSTARRYEEAVGAYREALARRPALAAAEFALAEALRQLNRTDEALALLQQILDREPRNSNAHNRRGVILRELGRPADALAAFDASIALDPTQTEPYLALISLKGVTVDDPRIGAMEQLAGRTDLPPDRRGPLLFALSQAYERAGRYEESFRHLLEGNRLRRSQVNYDERPARRRFERLRQIFTAELLAEKRDQGAASEVPIFVLGFPRSGTTLVEQILASHPAVHGAGELVIMGEIAAALTARETLYFPECMPFLGADALTRAGEAYVARMQALAPEAQRITDKMPDNYMFVGLIHLILPRARIIHLRRDPLDVCLSCFGQHFEGEINYSYDLRELGRYHRMYLDLMEHWRLMLPPGAMLEVQYESVVEDIESQARRILDYCGLPWDPRCIAFHQTDRVVRTASVDQVRRPIYRSSVQRWRHYEAQLAPLMEALAADPAAEPQPEPAPVSPPAMGRIGGLSALDEDLLPRALRAHREGKLAMADKLYRRILERTPGDVGAMQLLGVMRAQQRRFAEAEPLLAKAAAADPANPDVQNNLANVLMELGRVGEASERFRSALALRPAFPEAQYNLGNALRRQDRTEEAFAAYRAALALRPDYRDAMLNLADLLRTTQQPEVAIELLERLLSLRPKDSEAHGLLATALRQAGRIPEAIVHFDQAVTLNPRLAGAHYNRVRTMTVRADDPQLPVMEGLVARAQDLGEIDRSLLHMALGKAYEDTGRHDDAFASFREGKRLKRKLVPYDEAAMAARFESLHRVFTPALVAAAGGQGAESDLPIFVVGFPRSGTSLVEQILASHPQVHGAGELGYLDQIAASFRARAAPELPYPDYLAHLGAVELRALGDAYVARLHALAPGAGRITDKLPENYLNIGLIHLALPRARIIHVRREPLDVCVSCFAINFFAGLAYTSDLGELGRLYRRYLELMAHWRRLLPAGAMLEIQYEEVVGDLEGQARRLLDYCGLAWDPRCLAFHETQRSVRTASVNQVRQPLYRSSLERWRRYERHLGPLIEALGPEGAASVFRRAG